MITTVFMSCKKDPLVEQQKMNNSIIATSAIRYCIDKDVLPKEICDMRKYLVGLCEKYEYDQWGSKIETKYGEGKYMVRSYGPDGKPNNNDDIVFTQSYAGMCGK